MSKNISSSGIGFFGLLGLILIVLKLTDYIDWSWGWVLLPLYGGVGLLVVILGGFYLLVLALPKDKAVKPVDVIKKRRSGFAQKLEDRMEEAKERGRKKS